MATSGLPIGCGDATMRSEADKGAVAIGGQRGDDHNLGFTRGVALLVTPILGVAGVILYLAPHDTEQLWAWPMGPEMTALAVGGGYLAGATLFLRAARETRWHTVGIVFPAATVLTVLLLVATVLHWDLFSHGHPSFWAWLVVYAVTPVLLPAVWLVNRRHDPERPAPGTPLVPSWVRAVVGTVGAVQMAVALGFFVRPAAAIRVWPWELSPLTTRTISAFLAFIAAMWLAFLFEARWSALRLHVQSATIGLALVAGGAVRAGADFEDRRWQSIAFAALLTGTLVGLLALQLGMRRAGLPAVAGPVPDPEPVDREPS